METFENIYSPQELKEKYQITDEILSHVAKTRSQIEAIMGGKSSKKLFIVGPCSIHSYDETIEYAKKLANISKKVKDKILLIMRVFLEKPRTTIGWKGFVNDPDLNETYNIEKGLELSRKLLLEINKSGLGAATEFLDVLVYPYYSDLVTMALIGARTIESPTHRQMVSELLAPLGFKNSTSGSIEPAINAIISAKQEHCFLGIDEEGKVAKISTSGNDNSILILRGGDLGPNYEKEYVEESQKRLVEIGLFDSLMVDCSHGNSGKDYKMQEEIFQNVVEQMKTNPKLVGLMLESYLEEGNQKISSDLKKGVSVTDSCIGWKETEKLLLEAYKEL